MDNTGHSRKEDTQKLACPTSLECSVPGKELWSMGRVPENSWWTEMGCDGSCSHRQHWAEDTSSANLLDCWRAGEERALLHFLILRLPRRGSLDLQKTPHINDKVQVESQITSALQRKINVHQQGFSGATSVLGSLGWMDYVWSGHCVAGRIANWQIPWERSVPRRVGANFPNRETSWPTCKLHKEAGATILKLQCAWLLFSYSWLRIPRSKDAKLTWGGSLDPAP